MPSSALALDKAGDISFTRRWDVNREAPEAPWLELCDWSSMEDINWRTLRVDTPKYPWPQYRAIIAPSDSKVLSVCYEAPLNTGEKATLDLAERWMRECLRTHASCRKYRRPDSAPTRLLGISPENDGKISARLKERDEGHYSSNVKYLALSHRWLAKNEYQLLEGNKSQFSGNIEVASLKASIRDAMWAAIHLGIHYIWVDTLCIVQDNEEDKKAEIGMMDSIYSNALCTIAAGVGETANDGCFTSRDVKEVRTHRVHMRFGGGKSKHCLLRLSWNNTNQELDDTSLARRGWTFQERFLSPRTLHFCAKQVHWECRELKANETHPDGDTTKRKQGSNIRFADMATPWTEVIESYTTRSLTLSEDRLYAVQGVSDFLGRKWTEEGKPDEYSHGLWRNSLPHALLWSTKYRPSHDKRLEGVAPSWSWASNEEEIAFVYHNEHIKSTPLVTVLGMTNASAILNTDADRPNGCKDDVIRIRGRLCASTTNEDFGYISFGPQTRYDYKDAERGDLEATNIYLPISRSEPENLEGHHIETYMGIILRALGDNPPEAYERVGQYQQYCRVDGTDVSLGPEQDIYLF